jgi:type II secretory pathway component PulF
VLLADQGRALPAATRLLVAASMLLSRGAIPALGLAVVTVVALSRWMRTAEGRLAVHRALLELPILGDLRLRLATARACGALGSLLDGGVPILPALDLARDAADDAAVGRRIAAARIDVERGEPLATALKRHGALTLVALRLTAFGERAGRQAAFLEHAARLEASAAQRAIQRVVTLLEPVLILLFGAVVAFVAAALLQAVYSVRPGS